MMLSDDNFCDIEFETIDHSLSRLLTEPFRTCPSGECFCTRLILEKLFTCIYFKYRWYFSCQRVPRSRCTEDSPAYNGVPLFYINSKLNEE